MTHNGIMFPLKFDQINTTRILHTFIKLTQLLELLARCVITSANTKVRKRWQVFCVSLGQALCVLGGCKATALYSIPDIREEKTTSPTTHRQPVPVKSSLE